MVHSVVDFNMQLPLNALMMAVVFGVLANPGGKPSSSEQDSNTLVSSIFKWLLPVIGLSVIAYGAPMIQGEYLAEKSRVALRDGHTKKSLEIAREGLGKYHDNPELCFDAGEAALRLSDQEKKNTQTLCNESVKHFTAGLKIFPYDSRLALKLAQAQAASGNYFHALAAVSYAEKLDPNSSFVPAYRGVVEYSFGYSENAMVSFNHAIELGGEGAQIARSGMEMAQKALEMEAPARELPDNQLSLTDYPKRTEPENQSSAQSPHDHEKNSVSSESSSDLLNALPTITSPKQ
jgi:tetratricopeptide (TPR) repeat protein